MAELAPDIADKEFYNEVRRGLIIVIGALLRRYRLTWLDFLPREENVYIRRLAENQNVTVTRDSYSPTMPVANP